MTSMFISTISDGLQRFISSFYSASDVGPAGHDEYLHHFLPEAILIMGPTQYDSHEGIRRFRETAWDKVATRKHVVDGTFLQSVHYEAGPEVMLHGTVDYGFKDGSQKKGVQWAARMVLQGGKEGPYKLLYYQVYIR